jgi:hypothetical protein
MRLLPRTPRGTWLLATAVWLAGCVALWWALPYRPRAAWATEEPAVVHGFIPGTAVVLTSSPWSSTIDGPPGPMLGPLVARDAATGAAREWLPDGERLTLVEPGPNGRHVVIGRVIDGRARLFLHDAASGKVIAELPGGGPRAENENDQPSDANEQFAAFRPDGRQVVYADRVDGQRWLRVWDVDARRECAAVSDAEPLAAWSPDGEALAYTTHTGQVWTARLWDLRAARSRAFGTSVPIHFRPQQFSFSPDGGQVVASSLLQTDVKSPIAIDTEVIGWDTATGAELYRVPETGVAFPPHTSWFATGEYSTSLQTAAVCRWDYQSGAERGHFRLTDDFFGRWYSLSPGGNLLFGVAGYQNPILEILNRHVLGRAIAYSPTLRPQLWDTACSDRRYSLPMALDEVFVDSSRAGWSPDGALLAVASKDTLAVWDIPPRKPVKWLMAIAALLALPPFLIARRRVRRLRREVAA